MLIDWLPTALKLFCRVAPKSSVRRKVGESVRLFVSQVENLEGRQLLSATVMSSQTTTLLQTGPITTGKAPVTTTPTGSTTIPTGTTAPTGTTTTTTTGTDTTTPIPTLPPTSTGGISGVLQQIASGTGSTPDASGSTVSAADYVAFDAAGRVGVHIVSADIAGLQRSLSSLGFVTAAARPDLNFIEGFIPTSNLDLLGRMGVGVVPIYRSISRAGPTVDQATNVLGADRVVATTPPGYDGTGVRVGVISDSFNVGGARNLPAFRNGDLPSTVQVVKEGQAGLTGPFLQSINNDEGRAMAELIHDVAPGASIAFAAAGATQATMAQSIRDLANPALGAADIIVDDKGYFDEPFFQDGVISQAINEVFTNNGVAYFSAAGNIGTQSYENLSPSFVPDPNAGFGSGFGPGNYLDFGSAFGSGVDIQNQIFMAAGDTLLLTLQWDDPFYTTNGVKTDLDIFAVDGNGRIVASSTDNNIANSTPMEYLAYGATNFTTISIIVRIEPGSPVPGRLKWVDNGVHNSSRFFGGSTFNYDTQSSTAYGHVNADGALAVAAVPYYDSKVAEDFTSVGELIPAGSTTPAPHILFSPTGVRLAIPESRLAPDIAAIDGTNTSFFTGDIFNAGRDPDRDSLPNFFGTSAAAPHAAAVAALIKQANPGMSPQQIYDRLTSTADDITQVFDQFGRAQTIPGGGVGVDNVTGYGLINAYKAIFGSPIQAGLNFADSFESGALSGVWETRQSGSGTVSVGTTAGAVDGIQSLALGASFIGFLRGSRFFTQIDSQSEAILHIDLSTATDDVNLSFNAKTSETSGNSGTAMSTVFFDSELSDGVAFSVDGGSVWYRVVSLSGPQISDQFRNYTFNLTQIAGNAGVDLGNDVLLKFQHTDSAGFFFTSVPTTISVDNVQVYTKDSPTIVLNATRLAYPLNSPPVYIDSSASIIAPHTPVLDGGQLTVAIVANGASSDRVEILDQSKVPNYIPTITDITLSSNSVLFGGLQIGTFRGGNGSIPLTISLNSNATLAIVQLLLRDITFRASSNPGISRTIEVTLDDGSSAPTGSATRIVDVIAALNVAPTISLNPTSLNLQPGIAATIVDSTALVTDPDSSNLAGGLLTFKITNNASTNFDRLEIKSQGNGIGQIGFSGTTIKYQGVVIGTLSGGTTDRSITLTAAATPAAVQALVRSITFRTISSSAPLATRTVQFQLSDGDGGTSLVATKLINVVKKNQNPVLSGTATNPNFRLLMAPVIIEPAALVSDPDSLNFNTGTLTVGITANGTAFDKLSIRNQGSNIGQIAVSGGTNILYGGILIGTASGGSGTTSPLLITFNANANSAAVRALIRNITFETAGAVPSLLTRTINFILRDGQGGTSNLLAKQVTVTR